MCIYNIEICSAIADEHNNVLMIYLFTHNSTNGTYASCKRILNEDTRRRINYPEIVNLRVAYIARRTHIDYRINFNKQIFFETDGKISMTD